MFSCSIAGVWGRKMSETTEVSALPETRCAELRSERIVPIPQVPMPEKMFGSKSQLVVRHPRWGDLAGGPEFARR